MVFPTRAGDAAGPDFERQKLGEFFPHTKDAAKKCNNPAVIRFFPHEGDTAFDIPLALAMGSVNFQIHQAHDRIKRS